MSFYTVLITAGFALAAFGLFFAAMSLGRFFGRVRKRRCSCAEARSVMKTVADREKAARAAARYRPESVKTDDLPILPASLLDETRRDG